MPTFPPSMIDETSFTSISQPVTDSIRNIDNSTPERPYIRDRYAILANYKTVKMKVDYNLSPRRRNQAFSSLS